MALLVLLVCASAVTWIDGLAWTPDRMLLIFLVPALVIRRGRQYLRDFVPFVLLIFLYAECRGLAHIAAPHPFYQPQLWLERRLFGVVPSAWLQEHLWHGTAQWYDQVASKLLRIHFVVPPLVAFALWIRRRVLFYRFAVSMMTLSFSASLVFLIFPAAPPWAAARAGLLPGLVKLPPTHAHEISSVGFSTHAFSLARFVPSNPYAAIPSLHAGYALLAALTAARIISASRLRFRRAVGALCFAYPALQSFAVVYTGNHYVVDILTGFAFALVADAFAARLITRLTTAPDSGIALSRSGFGGDRSDGKSSRRQRDANAARGRRSLEARLPLVSMLPVSKRAKK